MASASKTYAASGTSQPLNLGGSDPDSLIHRNRPTQNAQKLRDEHTATRSISHDGHSHAGPRPRPVRGRHRLRLCLRTALRGTRHDLRLLTRRPRLRGPLVLPDLRAAAARAVLTARAPNPA